MTRPELVCLLPARNCSEGLPGWFESVSRFADAVVALDDGSTDDTGEALRRHPLVVRVVANPRRETYEGWDDAANRNRLLAEAEHLNPRWIMSLDADERIDPDDARVLRDFVETDRDRAAAYLFRVFRMIDNVDHWDRADMWAGRLFPFEHGQAFPNDRLHFVPLPTSIPREAWRRSTVRIQHLAGLTPGLRRARYAKYREVDPDHAYQDGYDHLLEGPVSIRPWEERPPDLPFVMGGSTGAELPDPGSSTPVLSAIVISRDDEQRIVRAVSAVVAQETPEPFEVIVVVSGTDRTAEIVRRRFPQVELVELDKPALPGAARNAGLAVARGRFASFPGSHVELPPGSLAERIDAHRAGYAMVTGSMHNGTETRAGWANYFLDHSTALPGRPSGPLSIFPVHCSYLRSPLVWAGGFPNLRAGEDTLVNRRLFELGYGAYRSSEIELTHHTRARTPQRLLGHHATRGRGLAALLMEEKRAGRLFTRAGLRQYVVVYVPGRLRRIHRNVMMWGDSRLRREYVRSWPLIALAAGVHWLAGWWHFLVSGSPGPSSASG